MTRRTVVRGGLHGSCDALAAALYVGVTMVTPMELIHVKVETKTKERIERLVRTERYKNKSEAVRKMLDEHFQEHPELFSGEELKVFLKEARRMSEAEFKRMMAEGLRGPKSAAEIVAEGRGAL